MTENTTAVEPSSPPTSSTDEGGEDKRPARLMLIQKAIARTAEAAERIELIARALKGEIGPFVGEHPLGEVTDHFLKIKEVFDRLDKAETELQAVFSFAKEVSMPERLDKEEIKTFNTDDARVTRTVRIFASIINNSEEDLPRAYQWLRDNGYGSLIKETVNSSSLSGAAKEVMEEGKEMPEDLFKVFMKDGISLTRKRKA